MFKRYRDRRIDAATRLKHQETFLKKEDFIWPIFLLEENDRVEKIDSMPSLYRYSADKLMPVLEEHINRGLKAVLLFGVPDKKGIEMAYSPEGIVQKAVPLIKKAFPRLEVITDVCLCSFTQDGHCHIGDNDKTCALLAKVALSHARAGADIVAPSDMMDGRVFYIRKALDEAGFTKVRIMSYAAKYASSFYGPFRTAADCAPKKGDRKSYQMDPPNAQEAMEEIASDIEEGASSIIIKPALSYLDIIYRAKQKFRVPIVAYNVSGEYSMLKLLMEKGLAGKDIVMETLISIKRAGADRIISYFTPEMLQFLE